MVIAAKPATCVLLRFFLRSLILPNRMVEQARRHLWVFGSQNGERFPDKALADFGLNVSHLERFCDKPRDHTVGLDGVRIACEDAQIVKMKGRCPAHGRQ